MNGSLMTTNSRAVLPLLGGVAAIKRDEAGARSTGWLFLAAISGEQLSWPGVAMARRHEELLEELLENEPARHHAFVGFEQRPSGW